MDREEFAKYKEDILSKAEEVMAKKESEYHSTYDVLSNLRLIAEFRETSTPAAIMNLIAKPLVSISQMVTREFIDLPEPRLDYSLEAWDEKFVDSINYLLKLYAAIREDKDRRPKTVGEK